MAATTHGSHGLLIKGEVDILKEDRKGKPRCIIAVMGGKNPTGY